MPAASRRGGAAIITTGLNSSPRRPRRDVIDDYRRAQGIFIAGPFYAPRELGRAQPRSSERLNRSANRDPPLARSWVCAAARFGRLVGLDAFRRCGSPRVPPVAVSPRVLWDCAPTTKSGARQPAVMLAAFFLHLGTFSRIVMARSIARSPRSTPGKWQGARRPLEANKAAGQGLRVGSDLAGGDGGSLTSD